MKAMTHQLQEVKSQVGKLQQDRDPFPFQPVIPNDNDDEDDWLGRALDTERRVKKIVDEMKVEMKAEMDAKLDAIKTEMKAEISEMKTEISATNVKLDAILKALKIES